MKPIVLMGGAEYKPPPAEVIAILQEIVAMNKLIASALMTAPGVQIPGHWPAGAVQKLKEDWEAIHDA